MCSHYQTLNDRRTYLRCFGMVPQTTEPLTDVWPGNMGNFIRVCPGTDGHGTADCEFVTGVFGLIPEWTQDLGISRHTFNAPCETVGQSPSYKTAWSQARHCIIPASAIFEPNCRAAKAIPTRIVQADGEPMGIAGLWSACQLPHKTIYSYTMLTINADEHALMRQFRKSTAEKRMVVVLPKERYMDWLFATPAQSMAFMQAYPAQYLHIAAGRRE